MAPGRSMAFETRTGALLVTGARNAIQRRLAGDTTTDEPSDWNPALRAKQASFVTLKRHGALRGCIGTLEAKRPLWEDVIHNAQAAAFEDPRFPPLTPPELEGLHIEISVLSSPDPLRVHSRAQLLALLKPGEDGLIVREGRRRATLLPAVWESLPDAGAFVDELMRKANLGVGYWSTSLEFLRYRTERFNDSGTPS